MQPLTEEEVTAALTSRKLWSAHLHSLTPQLTSIIETLAGLYIMLIILSLLKVI